jgi:hypothetical protein
MTPNFRRVRQIAALLGVALIVPLAALAVAGPAAADYPAQVKHSDGCTLTNYEPRYSNNKIIFSQKVVCDTGEIGYELNILGGWSATPGDEDLGEHNVRTKCLTIGSTSCSLTTSIQDSHCTCYYTSAVTDYVTGAAHGVNGIMFRYRTTDFIDL